MKKKFLLVAVLLIGCVLALTSCPSHTHTAATEWKSDANGHWHECTANDGTKLNEGAHNIVTVPGTAATDTADGLTEGKKCSICGYWQVPQQVIPAGHQHTFATDWTYDEINHWHAATCEHSSEVADRSAHTIIDVPGRPATEAERGLTDGKKCSVCGYWQVPQQEILRPGEHGHTYSDSWSYDATNHWHAATCEHSSERKDVTPHTIVVDPAVAPSYEAPGLTEGKHCSVCGAVIVAQQQVKMPYYDFVKAIANTTNPAGSIIRVKYTDSTLGELNASYTVTYQADGTATIAYSIEKFNEISASTTEIKSTQTGTVTRLADGTYSDGASFSGEAGADSMAFVLDLTKLSADDGTEEDTIATATVPAAKTADVLGTAFTSDVNIMLTIADGRLAVFSYSYTTASGLVQVTCEYN